jgi:hypothetical protein
MTHLKVMKLLSCLTESRKIMEGLGEYDDYELIELLEIKYEKMYHNLVTNG